MSKTTGIVAGAAVLAVVAGGVYAFTQNKQETTATGSGSQEIVLWDAMSGPYAKALDQQVEAFNESQDKYTIKRQGQGDYTALNQKITAAAKSKTLPDVAQATYTQVPDYQKQGIVTPLDAYITDEDQKQLENVFEGFLASSTYNDQYYSMPFSKSVRIMVYNKDILDKYNLEVPKTWEDIQRTSEVLKADGIATIGYDKSFDMELEGMSAAAGKKFVTEENGQYTANLTSDEVVGAAEDIMNMVNSGEAWTAGADNYGTNRFVEGKTAFYFSSSAGITATQQAAGDDLNWGTAPIPAYEGKQATVFAGNDLVMTATDKAKQAGVWEFMKFLLSDEQTLNWAKATGYVPLTKTAAQSDDYQAYLAENPNAKAAADSLENGIQSTAFSGYQDYRNEMLNAVDAMLTQKTAPKQALEAAQKTAEKIIEDNN